MLPLGSRPSTCANHKKVHLPLLLAFLAYVPLCCGPYARHFGLEPRPLSTLIDSSHCWPFLLRRRWVSSLHHSSLFLLRPRREDRTCDIYSSAVAAIFLHAQSIQSRLWVGWMGLWKIKGKRRLINEIRYIHHCGRFCLSYLFSIWRSTTHTVSSN